MPAITSGSPTRRATSIASAAPLSGWMRPKNSRYPSGHGRRGKSSVSTPWWIVATYSRRGCRSASLRATEAAPATRSVRGPRRATSPASRPGAGEDGRADGIGELVVAPRAAGVPHPHRSVAESGDARCRDSPGVGVVVGAGYDDAAPFPLQAVGGCGQGDARLLLVLAGVEHVERAGDLHHTGMAGDHLAPFGFEDGAHRVPAAARLRDGGEDRRPVRAAGAVGDLRPVDAPGADGGRVVQPPLVSPDEQARGVAGQRARLPGHDRSLRRPAVPIGRPREMEAVVPAVETAVD